MVCAVCLGFGIHFYPYSPRWLGLKGREEDCLQSLCSLRRLPPTDSRVQTEYQAIMTEVEFQTKLLERQHPGLSGFKLEIATWMDLFRKKSWRRTAVGTGVAFFQQFSGINGMNRPDTIEAKTELTEPPTGFIYYAPILFRSLGADDELSLILSGTLNLGQLVAVVICFFIIDRVGRRPLAIYGALGMATPYIIMSALVGLYSSDWAGNKAAGWATIAMAYIYVMAYGISYSPLTWSLPSECFSNGTRAKGVALSTSVVWLCNFIIGVIVPTMIEQAGFGTYVFFAIFCLLAAVWAYFLVPETKGRTLEQMDEVFGDASAAEEKAIMAEVVRCGGARRMDMMVQDVKV